MILLDLKGLIWTANLGAGCRRKILLSGSCYSCAGPVLAEAAHVHEM